MGGNNGGMIPQKGPAQRPPKVSTKQLLHQSEERAQGLAKYLQVCEMVCKKVLLVAAEKYDSLQMILTPEGQEFQKVLAEICQCVAPICEDVENMDLSPQVMQALVKKGGKVLRFPTPGGETTGEESEGETPADVVIE